MPTTKALTDFYSSAVEADDINLHSCADFRQKWVPSLFCKLPLSERRAILRGMLTSSNPVSIVQEGEVYGFATESTSIHEAMPLLHDYSTNKQIAREACEAFYQVGTFSSNMSIGGTLISHVLEQHVHSILSLASFFSLRSDGHMDSGRNNQTSPPIS